MVKHKPDSLLKRKLRTALIIRLALIVVLPTGFYLFSLAVGKSDVNEGGSRAEQLKDQHTNNFYSNSRKLFSIWEEDNINGGGELSNQDANDVVHATEGRLSKREAIFQGISLLPPRPRDEQWNLTRRPRQTSENESSSTVETDSNPETSTTETTVAEAYRSTIGSHIHNCSAPAIKEFPDDGFTRWQRRQGWITLHLILACYLFWFLAIICDDYFVPAIESMCATFKMKEDVAGATFMAAATSSPELFINSIGTFITKSDLGVGTIVGAAVFNVLAVPACCGIFAKQAVQLDWYPITRDASVYAVAVVGLIWILLDDKVMWYEALVLVAAYFLYITLLYYNDVVSRKAKLLVAKYRKKHRVRPFKEVTEISPLLSKDKMRKEEVNGNTTNHMVINGFCEPQDEDEVDFASNPWQRNDENSVAYILKWPLVFVLWLTVPDCRKRPQLRLVTFAACIIYIGLTSYLVSFLITVFGDTINIPDSVMGLTFLAAGTSVPEAVSSVIVTNQGHGAMGISNSLGSNTFDILLCLGIPWLVKSLACPAVATEHWVSINSSGITYCAISLLSTLLGLYVTFAVNKFRLDHRVGITCALMYLAFLVMASLIEMNVFFFVNPPICDH